MSVVRPGLRRMGTGVLFALIAVLAAASAPAAQGPYVLKAELVESTPADPDPTDDGSTVIAVVKTTIGPVVASAVRITPKVPKAGAPVSARVRVTADGVPVVTHAPVCTGRLPN